MRECRDDSSWSPWEPLVLLTETNTLFVGENLSGLLLSWDTWIYQLLLGWDTDTPFIMYFSFHMRKLLSYLCTINTGWPNSTPDKADLAEDSWCRFYWVHHNIDHKEVKIFLYLTKFLLWTCRYNVIIYVGSRYIMVWWDGDTEATLINILWLLFSKNLYVFTSFGFYHICLHLLSNQPAFGC